MKFALLFLAFALWASTSNATTYYFSSVAGDDNRTAGQAQNPSTPWKTLDKFNAIANTLKPGDSVLLRRGETFYGTLVTRASGVPGNVVYYGAFGSGANPVITGFTTLTGWTTHSNASISWVPLDMPNLQMVTINGEAKGMGRFPNTGYLNYEGHNGNQSITDNQLAASPNWTGAEIVMRKFRFIIDRHTVTSHSGTTLNYSLSTVNGNNGKYLPENGNGYFFQNHLGTLDQPGEWYYDNAAKRLYVFFGAAAPSGFVVKASTRGLNAAVEDVDYVTVENLTFEGANLKGLSVAHGSNIVVRNCDFNNQGATSLHADFVSHVLVKGGSVNTSFSNGINFEHEAVNCTIDGVSVHNSNVINGTGRSGTGVSIGISVTGTNNTIINNRIIGAGWSGIQFLGNNVLVERNYIEQFCTLKDDGGGVYTFNGAANEINSNRKIRNNIILNAIGAYAGAEKYSYEPFGKAAGIYLDEHVNNCEITGNTIANGDWGGIFLHNAHQNLIADNLIYNFRYQVHVSQYSLMTRNNTMTGNQYIARTASQMAWYYRTFVVDNPSTMGTFNNNYYARPIKDDNTIQIDNYWTGGNGTSFVTLAQWKASYGLDAASQKSPLTYASNIDDNLRFEYNATNAVKIVALNAAYIDVKGTQYSGSIGLQPFTAVVLLKTTAVFPQNQVITFPTIPNKVMGDPAFTLNATSTSGLPVTYSVVSGPATVSGNQVTLTGVGSVTIAASQGGNSSFKPADVVQQAFTVLAPNTQTITFPAIANKIFGSAPFTINATASSGLPVSFQVVSGYASVSGNTVTLNGAGISTIILEAVQPGNSTFRAAAPVRQSFTVARGGQTVTFGALAGRTFGEAPFALTATASSGLAPVYRITSGPATVSGNMLTLTGSGEIIVEASQPGNADWEPAFAVSRNFYASKGAQTITFPVLANKRTTDPPFNLTATASSGLPVSYRISAGPATVSGSTVTITGAGEVWIEASQAGNADYNAAASQSRSFVASVSKQSQTITFPAIGNRTFGAAPFTLNATASSGLPVSYRVVSGPASVSGNTVTLTGSGSVQIEASQAGNATYNAASSITQTFFVAKANQSITFNSLPGRSFGDAPFALTATASSDLAVVYRVVSGPATLSGNTITLTGVGTVTIEAAQPGNANYNVASTVSQFFAVSKGSQTITFPAISNKNANDAPFALSATASSGLPVAYRVVSGPATVSANSVTLTGTGEVWIEATQTGNANYNPASAVSRNFFVSTTAGQEQTITFLQIPDKTFGDAPFGLNATASSGLPVSYRVVSGPASVANGTVTINGTGQVIIEASQGGNGTYSPAAAVSRSFAVSKAGQTITFAAIANKTTSDAPFPVSVSASSGLPVSLQVLSGPATISGTTVTLTGVGEVIIQASQAGNSNYNPASLVSQSFLVTSSTATKQSQSITFGSLSYRTYNSPPFTLSATASSGLPVSYRVVSGPVTISSNLVTIHGVGNVTIEASQSGDATYNPANPVLRSFTIGKASQTITFNQPPNRTFGEAPFQLNATASSGLAVIYRVVSGPATVSGNTVTLTGTGTVNIEASQPGDANFNAAFNINRSFTVSPGSGAPAQNQAITFNALPNRTFGEAPFQLNATASSGLPVSYKVNAGPATVSGNTVTITGTGTVTIEASQAGNSSYNAATPVVQSFAVGKATQTIVFGPLPDRNFGDPAFAVSATASSGLPVNIRVVSGPASISGTTVTLSGTGTVVLEATQAGDGNYLAATPVQQSFVVNGPVVKQSQTITFGSLAYKIYNNPPFELTATASSGLPVVYRVVSGPVAISGSTVTITGVGNVLIEATQPGNTQYNPATPVQRSFTIGKAGQTITFNQPPNRIFGEAPFQLNATASSGLPVVYRVVSGPATVSDNTVTLTGSGTVTIEASQPGNEFYTAASFKPQRSFTVSQPASAPVTSREATRESQTVPLTVQEKDELSLFPNPLRGQGFVKVVLGRTEQGFVSVYDREGKQVRQLGLRRFEKGVPAIIRLDMGGLPQGAYFLRLTTNKRTISYAFRVM